MKKPILQLLCIIVPVGALATRSVRLAWGPSPDSTVAGYNIYYGPASRTYTNIVSFGKVTNATVSGLIEGGMYFFTATAYDGTGLESDFSNEVGYLVPTNSTLPAPVMRVIQ